MNPADAALLRRVLEAALDWHAALAAVQNPDGQLSEVEDLGTASRKLQAAVDAMLAAPPPAEEVPPAS